jgi:hydroxyethylthiazole kinase-like uncharacterized protein yjeF
MVELTKEFVRQLLPPRTENSNKGTYGNVLNIAGSINYRGAASLSSLGALRVGAGYVSLACPEMVANSVTSYTPDIVTIPLRSFEGSIAEDEYKRIFELSYGYKVVSLGCGLFSLFNHNEQIKYFFKNLIEMLISTDLTVVIDADGLNTIAELHYIPLPKKTILTPHPKELARLLKVGVDEIQMDRVQYAEKAARRFASTVVLKGHHTLITDGEISFINTTGNSALAKAGSGDVLTGMIAGFCAQGLAPVDAACLGVYLHGKAGDLAQDDLTAYGIFASDLLTYIPRAIKTLLS